MTEMDLLEAAIAAANKLQNKVGFDDTIVVITVVSGNGTTLGTSSCAIYREKK